MDEKKSPCVLQNIDPFGSAAQKEREEKNRGSTVLPVPFCGRWGGGWEGESGIQSTSLGSLTISRPDHRRQPFSQRVHLLLHVFLLTETSAVQSMGKCCRIHLLDAFLLTLSATQAIRLSEER